MADDRLASVLEKVASLKASDINADNEARVEALQRARELVALLEKPKDAIFINAFLPTQTTCLRIAVDLKLFHHLASSASKTAQGNGILTTEEIASLTGADELLIIRICRILVGAGFLAEEEVGTVSATPRGNAMTQEGCEGAVIHFFEEALPVLAILPKWLREHGFKNVEDSTNGPFQLAKNTKLRPVEHWIEEDTAAFTNFNIYMEKNRGDRPSWLQWWPVKERLLDGIRKRDAPVFVDVAGGYGHDLADFSAKFPGLDFKPSELFLEDLPDVIDEGQKKEEKEGLGARFTRMKHDFFTPQPIRGARAYFMHFIMHGWQDSDCLKILRQVKDAMEPGYSKLLINEIILPDKDCPLHAAGFDIMMLAVCAGMERSESQWRHLLYEAGFTDVKLWAPPGKDGEGIIEATI